MYVLKKCFIVTNWCLATEVSMTQTNSVLIDGDASVIRLVIQDTLTGKTGWVAFADLPLSIDATDRFSLATSILECSEAITLRDFDQDATKMVSRDIFQAGYDVTGCDRFGGAASGNYHSLEVTGKNNGQQLQQNCLFTVNGAFHHAFTRGDKLIISSGALTAKKSGANINVLCFSSAGGVSSRRLTEDDIVLTMQNGSVRRITVCLPSEATGAPYFVLAGLLVFNDARLYRSSDNRLEFDVGRVDVAKWLAQMSSVLDLSEVISPAELDVIISTETFTVDVMMKILLSEFSFVGEFGVPYLVCKESHLPWNGVTGEYFSYEADPGIVEINGAFPAYYGVYSPEQTVLQFENPGLIDSNTAGSVRKGRSERHLPKIPPIAVAMAVTAPFR